jgi:DNA invertase Pin-like site-specific DNA recombinase
MAVSEFSRLGEALFRDHASVWFVDAQVRQLTKAGCKKVFREVALGAKTDRAQLRRLLAELGAGRRGDGDAA